MSDIFISCSSDDLDFARTLIAELDKRTSWKSWLFKDHLLPSEQWAKVIDETIEGCLVVIVILSESSNSSTYVAYEWAYGDGMGRPVIALLIDDVADRHPKFKDDFEIADFTQEQDWDKFDWDKFIEQVEEIIDRSRTVIRVPRGTTGSIQNSAEALNSPDIATRASALETLRQAGRDNIEAEAVQQIFRQAIRVMPSRVERMNVAFMLGEIFHDSAAVEVLADTCRQGGQQYASTAARILGMIDDTSAIDALCEIVDADLDNGVRRTAARSLGQIGNEQSGECLLQKLGTTEGILAVQEEVINAIAAMQERRAKSAITKIIKGETPNTAAILTLGKIGDRESIAPLIEILDKAHPENIKQAAIIALGMIGDRGAVDVLITFAKGPNPQWVGAAIIALGRIGDAKALPTINIHLNSRYEAHLLERPSDIGANRIRQYAHWAKAKIEENQE